MKGIRVIGTGDFTHPEWFRELSEKLEPAGNGLFQLKKEFRTDDVPGTCTGEVFFMLTAEISCIYRKRDRTRKVHALILAPGLAEAARISMALSRIGNLSSDGRPILGLDAKELLRITLDSAPDGLFVPAHAWTPHFSVFGAASGFDSLDECFDELTPFVYAVETGLSSDPLMNWRLSALDNITLISNSDAHSPSKIGREANIFDTDTSFEAIASAIKTRKGMQGTVEFFPEEGKYHYDGHRACGVSLSPEETISHNHLCPVCGRKVTVGVMHRVAALADRKEGTKPSSSLPFHSVIPLQEIIAETLKTGPASKKVGETYFSMLRNFGNEFNILLDVPIEEIERSGLPLIGEALKRMRSGRVSIAPGYDGEYGKIRIFESLERKEIKGQKMLF